MDGVGRSSGDSGGHSAGARVDEEGMGMGWSKSESLKPALVVLVSVCPSMKDSMPRAGSRGVSVGSRESNAQGQRVNRRLFIFAISGGSQGCTVEQIQHLSAVHRPLGSLHCD